MKKAIVLILFNLLLAVFLFAQPGGKYILLEEFSTAPCGFCPDGDLIAADIIKKYPKVIWVTHHAGFGTDSMTVTESVSIATAFTTGAPMAPIDRGDYKIPVYTIAPYIAVSRQKWDSICVAHLNDAPVVDIGISNQYNSSTRMLNSTVYANFKTVPASGDMRINLYLMEDSIVGMGKGYDQKNYFNTNSGHPFYQKGDEIVGYVHHHVMRKIPGGAWGVSGIIPSTPLINNNYSYTFSNISIPVKWNVNKMDVIAFVSYHNTNAALRQVLNSNHKNLLDATPAAVNAVAPLQEFISVYPNPASEKIFVSTGFQGKLEIMNFAGQVLNTFNPDQNKHDGFSVAGLPNGVYFYKLIDSDQTVVQGKLVIMH